MTAAQRCDQILRQGLTAMWRSRRSQHNRHCSHEDDAMVDRDGGVAAAAEAMLAGGAVSLFLASGQAPPPAWAFLNFLAHASFDELRLLAATPNFLDPRGWFATTAYLAAELVSGEKRSAGLEGAQRDVLVPLELDILAGRLDGPAAPAELASLVMGAFEHHTTWRS